MMDMLRSVQEVREAIAEPVAVSAPAPTLEPYDANDNALLIATLFDGMEKPSSEVCCALRACNARKCVVRQRARFVLTCACARVRADRGIT